MDKWKHIQVQSTYLDRHSIILWTNINNNSPVHFSICSTCPTCPFEQRNQPAWPKTPRQEFICPSQYTAVVWRPCSIEAALVLYIIGQTHRWMDGWMSRTFSKKLPKGKWSQVPSFFSHPFESNTGFTPLHHYNIRSKGHTLVMGSKNIKTI